MNRGRLSVRGLDRSRSPLNNGLEATVKVLSDATTDHRPVLASIDLTPTQTPATNQPVRRNFNKITRDALLQALEEWPWSRIYEMHNEEAVHKYIIDGITAALDKVAPLKRSKILRREDPYLRGDTLNAMARRDSATSRSSYRFLRNKVTSMVRRDKLQTNLHKLEKAKGDPKVLWELANQALGKASRTPLPASLLINGSPTGGKAEMAEAMNSFYIDKINKLRAKLPKDKPAPLSKSPPKARFKFSFANAAKITKIIQGLSNTTALGNDAIPTTVLKLGADCLAGPVSHLVNRSLSNSRVPTGFKEGRVIPIFKGKGKPVTDPASYRPVSLLPALSKVLELVVKEDLEAFLQNWGGLPNSQFGFRPKRSTTTAIAAAHGSWLHAAQLGETVAILAFDFSAAFDTVDPDILIDKLTKLGIGGRQEIDWFRSYMTGGQQSVDWDGVNSSLAEVRFGVRQGSILGPLLFLTLMADLPSTLKIEENCIIGYADDVCLWTTGKDLGQMKTRLDKLAAAFVDFAHYNALALNPDKTQLLLAGGNVTRARREITVKVDKVTISPGSSLDLLGVSFDSSLSSVPYGKTMVAAARQRAALVTRLGMHLPRGPFLRQLAQGLVLGKLGYAAAAMAPVRLLPSDPVPEFARSIQTAINDVARSLTGSRRADRVKIPELLQKAGLTSYNNMVVRAVALEAWKAYHSCDGPNGDRNPLGLLIFGPRDSGRCKVAQDAGPTGSTRAATAGKIRHHMSRDCMVTNCVRVWNLSNDLRAASSIRSAISAARTLADQSPL